MQGYGAASEDVDDLSRNVFGLLGLPLDSINFATLLGTFESLAGKTSPFLISTANVNFLVTSQRDYHFRESVLQSDLCLADGMPLIWIAKLLRIPVHERIAGSDLFGRLKSRAGKARQLKVFLLGGADGLAESVCQKLNGEKQGLECVGVLNPGFGTIEEMSTAEIIDRINTAGADLLAVFFGAQKAQAWLMYNHHRLSVPIRAQFGATINFEAGTVKRAPHFIRNTGFEWLWRIKEEPYLWRRYWSDGKALVQLMATCVLPLVIDARLRRREASGLSLKVDNGADLCTVEMVGDADASNVEQAIAHFRVALNSDNQIVINISRITSIDSRFFGLFLMIRKCLASTGRRLTLAGASPEIRRVFSLNRFEFLLAPDCDTNGAESLPDLPSNASRMRK